MLGKSEVTLDNGHKIVVNHDMDFKKVRAIGRDDGFVLSVEEAYFLGSAIVRHALFCGFDPFKGETREELVGQNDMQMSIEIGGEIKFGEEPV